MIEIPLIFVAGFLGSSHCVGMCGPFAMLLGGTVPTWRSNLTRQFSYSGGRIFTYGVLGAVAGYFGAQFTSMSAGLVNIPAILAIAAGCFLLYQGLKTAGIWKTKSSGSSASSCLAGGLLSHFLRSPSQSDVFLAGLLTGFLPCGLVYGFIGIAASTQSITFGLLTMVAFGLGTVPVMVATGFGSRVLSIGGRAKLVHFAGWCVVLAGVVSIARGVSYVGLADASETLEACPFCP